MAPQPATERGRQARGRIVAAAADVVAKRGALGGSLDEVGVRANASRSQLYHYFDDKDDLLLAVAEATNDAVLDAQQSLSKGSIPGQVCGDGQMPSSNSRSNVVGAEAVPLPTWSLNSANATTTSVRSSLQGSIAGK
jgi:AcrR family transcriptional regulator